MPRITHCPQAVKVGIPLDVALPPGPQSSARTKRSPAAAGVLNDPRFDPFWNAAARDHPDPAGLSTVDS